MLRRRTLRSGYDVVRRTELLWCGMFQREPLPNVAFLPDQN